MLETPPLEQSYKGYTISGSADRVFGYARSGTLRHALDVTSMARFKYEQDPIELLWSELHTKAIVKFSAKGKRTGHEKPVLGIAAATTNIRVASRDWRNRAHHALRATIEYEKEPWKMKMKILRCERSFLETCQIAKDRHQH